MVLMIYLGFIAKVAADVSFNDYKVHKNRKAELDVTTRFDSLSVVQCTAQCSKKEGCSRVNWSPETCELLQDPIGDIEFSEDHNYKYICKYDKTFHICDKLCILNTVTLLILQL